MFLCFFLLNTLQHASLDWYADFVFWHCVGHTAGVYWALYWTYWVCVLGHVLDWLTLSRGPSTGHTDFLYWNLYWVDWFCVLAPLLDLWFSALGGPGMSLRFSHDVLIMVPGGLGLHHDTSVVYRMCVDKKYVACPSDDNPFLLMMTTSSYFLLLCVSLLLSFKHFTTCQGLLQPPSWQLLLLNDDNFFLLFY